MPDPLGMGRGEGGGEKARDEFFSEAQELVDALGRDLLALDNSRRAGRPDPQLLNDVFRSVHTLKGLSGLFGAATMSGLSHELETLLDEVRLGRIDLTAQVVDLLFRSVDLYGQILASARSELPEPVALVKALLVAVSQVHEAGAGHAASVVAQYELDPGVLAVLTEYEEHRLRENLQQGLALYRVRTSLHIAAIESGLDELRAKTRPFGEIITYLPAGEGGSLDSVELELLVASRAQLRVLQTELGGPSVSVEEVRRHRPSVPTPPLMPDASPLPSSWGASGEAAVVGVAAQEVVPTQGFSEANLLTRPPQEASLRSVAQTVRVDIQKLDHLMSLVGDLAVARGQIAKLAERMALAGGPSEVTATLARIDRAFDRRIGEMQSGILEVRMVPLGQVFDKLARIVRQICRDYGKEVTFVVTGAETEIDKLIVEELSDPLLHMIRNAIDHGIEGRDERLHVRKPVVGTIALNAFQKGRHVVIQVEDDGRGMDPAIMLTSALKRGLVSEVEARSMSAKDVLQLAFVSGFSTREEPTRLSGRGVGMDVVKTNIARLGGVVDLESNVGIGTKITVTLPMTLAMIGVLLVETCGQTFLLPLSSVEEASPLDEHLVRSFDGREVMSHRGTTVPIARLSRLLRLDENVQDATKRQRRYVVLTSVAGRRLGFVVDRLVGREEIVIKPLGQTLRGVRGFSGGAVLSEHRVGLVLDVPALIDEALSNSPALGADASESGPVL